MDTVRAYDMFTRKTNNFNKVVKHQIHLQNGYSMKRGIYQEHAKIKWADQEPHYR